MFHQPARPAEPEVALIVSTGLRIRRRPRLTGECPVRRAAIDAAIDILA